MSEGSALLIDFGSTYTKLRAVSLGDGRVLGSGQGRSTVESDVTVGLQAALDDLQRRLGGLPDFRYRLASSSAAGGLRMVTVGLVRELTAEAARRAALGAGAKLAGTFAYDLTADDADAITALAPDILLLAGGTDGGNRDVIEHNARMLAETALACPILVAGNRTAKDGVRAVLEAAGKTVRVTENVMPEFNVLNVEPAREAIRQVFMERIVHAKGIDKAAALFDAVLMPTPAAVLEGARLLADALGDLVVIDIGGATTDVHSVCDGAPTREGVVVQGLPQPFLSRSVEGDLGMRISAPSTVEAVGLSGLAEDAGVGEARMTGILDKVASDIGHVPESADERAFDRALARAAVGIAVRRHAGTTETVFTATGPATIQKGKDLGGVGTVIGTGGVLAHGTDAAEILAPALADPAEPQSLRPKSPSLLLDRAYILYACGLLGSVEAETARRLGLANLETVKSGQSDGRSSVA